MAELINLNKARKARDRAAAKAQAAENRVKFGRGKDEKTVVEAGGRAAPRARAGAEEAGGLGAPIAGSRARSRTPPRHALGIGRCRSSAGVMLRRRRAASSGSAIRRS